MIKIIKKNQLTILVLALMLVTAGYLNYNENIQTSTEVASIGDATLVSSNLSNSITNTIQTQANEITSNAISNTSVASSISTTKENARTVKYKVQRVIEELLFEEVRDKMNN